MRTATPLATALLLLGLAGPPVRAQEGNSMAAFAFGRGREALKAAVSVQRSLRELIPTTGTFGSIDIPGLLDEGATSPRSEAVAEARALLDQGKAAYEQLDLEVAQTSFDKAVKKFEYGYGHLDRPALLVESLMYLGATWALVGESEKATRVFMRALDLPGRKVLDPNLFPPNIQEIFSQAGQLAESKRRGSVKLLTVPQGAEVVVDDVYRGGSPVKVTDLRPGVHLVRVLKDGYQAWGGKIKVSPGKTRSFKMQLRPTRRHREFSGIYRGVVAEVMRDEPGEAMVELAEYLKATHVAVVALEGEPAAMRLRGYLCDVKNMKLATHEQVLDTTSPGYGRNLKTFCQKLLAATPASSRPQPGEEGYAAGEADAAALLAKVEGGGSESAESEGGLGLDLEVEKPGPAEGAATGSEMAPPPGEGGAEDGAEVGAASTEPPGEENLHASVEGIERTAPEPEPGFSWGYLSRKWWFWTAVGVVAAGAATGTYFLATSGGGGGGTLVLDLH